MASLVGRVCRVGGEWRKDGARGRRPTSGRVNASGAGLHAMGSLEHGHMVVPVGLEEELLDRRHHRREAELKAEETTGLRNAGRVALHKQGRRECRRRKCCSSNSNSQDVTADGQPFAVTETLWVTPPSGPRPPDRRRPGQGPHGERVTPTKHLLDGLACRGSPDARRAECCLEAPTAGNHLSNETDLLPDSAGPQSAATALRSLT